MASTRFRSWSPLSDWLAGSMGAVVCVGTLACTTSGCSPAPAPVVPVPRPVAVKADHDHHEDHDHHDKHDHGKASGTHDEHGDDDHAHAHPETLAAGVAELETLWGHVKTALKAGDRDKADDKVHDAGHLLEDFEALVANEKSDLQEAGKQATQEVFECFDILDTALHGAEDDLKKVDVDELGGRLEKAFKSLKELAGGTAK